MSPCKHLRSFVTGGCRIGYVWCPDCKLEVPLADMCNNLFKEMRRYLDIEEHHDS